MLYLHHVYDGIRLRSSNECDAVYGVDSSSIVGKYRFFFLQILNTRYDNILHKILITFDISVELSEPNRGRNNNKNMNKKYWIILKRCSVSSFYKWIQFFFFALFTYKMAKHTNEHSCLVYSLLITSLTSLLFYIFILYNKSDDLISSERNTHNHTTVSNTVYVITSI